MEVRVYDSITSIPKHSAPSNITHCSFYSLLSIKQFFFQFFTRLAIQGSGSYTCMCNNYNFILSMFNLPYDFIVHCDIHSVISAIHFVYEHFYNFVDDVSVQNACFIREIPHDLYSTPPGFILQHTELQDTLLFLCTD